MTHTWQNLMKTLHPRWYQIILPGTVDHKGTVGICPKNYW